MARSRGEPDDTCITHAYEVEAEPRRRTSRRFDENCLAIWRPGQRSNTFAAGGKSPPLLPFRGCRHEVDVAVAAHLDAERKPQHPGCPWTRSTKRSRAGRVRPECERSRLETAVERDVAVADRPVDGSDGRGSGKLAASGPVGPHQRVSDVHDLRRAEVRLVCDVRDTAAPRWQHIHLGIVGRQVQDTRAIDIDDVDVALLARTGRVECDSSAVRRPRRVARLELWLRGKRRRRTQDGQQQCKSAEASHAIQASP